MTVLSTDNDVRMSLWLPQVRILEQSFCGRTGWTDRSGSSPSLPTRYLFHLWLSYP